MLLYTYYRSTASWRVRIALALKNIPSEHRYVHLRNGEQQRPEYMAVNPQGLVPTLQDGPRILTQSLAICEYLDETQPGLSLVPADPWERAQVRAFSQVIACDIHPVQNLKVLKRLRAANLPEAEVTGWAASIIEEGLDACADLLDRNGGNGPFCFGTEPTLADICLVPQLYNARRFGTVLRWPRLLEIEENAMAMPAFSGSAPEAQPDAE